LAEDLLIALADVLETNVCHWARSLGHDSVAGV